MPWVDILIVLLIALGALIGYNIGFLGAFKGFISKIAGLICALLLTPIAQAWLESRWGVESFLAALIARRIPASFSEVLSAAAQTAQTFQELQERLYLSFPPEIALYLKRSLSNTTGHTVPSPDMVLSAVAREIAQCVMWAFLFLLIWLILSITIKAFIGMIFIKNDGKTILGVFDGFLGMVAMTCIVVASMIVFCGLGFPALMIAKPGGNWARVYPYITSARLVNWMAGMYQCYVIPWIR